MPYRNTPWVCNGQVINPAGPAIKLDTADWFAWLETISAFAYGSRHFFWWLTIRREKRRHQSYWYGYRKIEAKLHNIYLGKTEQLTQAHLEQACRTLDDKVRQERKRLMNRT